MNDDASQQPYAEESDHIVRRLYRKENEGNAVFEVAAYILPSGMVWPTFLAFKQGGSSSRNIYFQRQTLVDVNRRSLSLQYLRNKRRVLWTGFPGIGKSTDINYILMELLRHMGEESWPAMVAFRVDDYLFEFTSSDVRCVPIKFTELVDYAANHEDDDSMLILELADEEKTPLFRMPFIIAESSRRAREKFKSYILADCVKIMLVTPPDVEEVCLMAEAIMEVCPTDTIFDGKTKAEAISLVRERAFRIGAIPRYLFGSKSFYTSRLLDMTASATSKSPFENDVLNIDDLNPFAQHFVAPYFKYGVTDPTCLSQYKTAAPELFASLSDDDEMYSLARTVRCNQRTMAAAHSQ